MKLIFKIAALILFILFFGFALKNTQEATLQFFLNYELRSPLVLLLLGFFTIGFVFGILGMASIVMRLRRDLARQKKVMDSLQLEKDAQTVVRAQPASPASLAVK